MSRAPVSTGRSGRGAGVLRVVGGALRLLAVAPDEPVNGPEDLPSTPHWARCARRPCHERATTATARSLAQLTAGFVAVPADLW